MSQVTDLASRFVDVERLPWQKTPFAGIEFKPLLVDKASGVMTLLMRMAPGVKLPDHEHVEIEQTYVLEGSLVCPEGECRAGQFVWRPVGSRHTARTPNGARFVVFFRNSARTIETGRLFPNYDE